MKILLLSLNLLFVIILLTQISFGEGKDRDKHKSCRGDSRTGNSGDACNPGSRDREDRIKRYEKEHQGRYHDDDDDEDDDDDDDDYDDSGEDLTWSSDDEANAANNGGEAVNEEGATSESKRTGKAGDKSEGRKIKGKDDKKSKKTRQVPGEGKGKSESKKNKDKSKYTKGDKGGQASVNEKRDEKGNYRREKGGGIRKRDLRPTDSKEGKSGKESKEKRGMNNVHERGDKSSHSQDSTSDGEGEATTDDEASRTVAEAAEDAEGVNKDSGPKDTTSEAGASVPDTSTGGLETEEVGDGSTPGHTDAAKEAAGEMNRDKITGDHETQGDVEELHGRIDENIADKEELREATLNDKDANIMENGTPDVHPDAHGTVEKADDKVDNPVTEGEMIDADGGGLVDSFERTSTPESARVRELPTVTLEFDSSTMLPEHMRVGKSYEPEEAIHEETWESEISGGRRVEVDDLPKEEEEFITDSNNNEIPADSLTEGDSQNEGVDEASTLESEHDIDSEGDLENLETEGRPEGEHEIESESDLVNLETEVRPECEHEIDCESDLENLETEGRPEGEVEEAKDNQLREGDQETENAKVISK